MDLEAIKEIARERRLIFTEHAIRQMLKRDITVDEVREAVLSGEIIEEYPDDKYSQAVFCTAKPRQDDRFMSNALHRHVCGLLLSISPIPLNGWTIG